MRTSPSLRAATVTKSAGDNDNAATGDYAAVGGGFKNDATHTVSWVAGEYSESSGLYTVVY